MDHQTERTAGGRTFRTGIGIGIVGGLVAVGAALFAFLPAVGAAEGDANAGTPPPRPALTADQQACLQSKGITKPTPGVPPTAEQRAAFRASAQECGLPAPGPKGPGGPHGLQLTADQQACLQSKGITKPTPGVPPTAEQRAAFRASAQECGLPAPGPRGPGGFGGPRPPQVS